MTLRPLPLPPLSLHLKTHTRSEEDKRTLDAQAGPSVFTTPCRYHSQRSLFGGRESGLSLRGLIVCGEVVLPLRHLGSSAEHIVFSFEGIILIVGTNISKTTCLQI